MKIIKKQVLFLLLSLLSLDISAQVFSLSGGPSFVAGEPRKGNPESTSAGFFRIEREAILHDTWKIGFGGEIQWLSLEQPFPAGRYIENTTYICVPITVYKEAKVDGKFVPFISSGTNVMMSLDNSHEDFPGGGDEGLEHSPVVLCFTAGAGIKHNVSENFFYALKLNYTQQVNYAFSYDGGLRFNTISIGIAIGGRLKSDF